MSEKDNSLDLIPERKKLFGTSIKTLLSEFLNFENKTLIIFDLETLGLNPGFEYEQILEIAAVAINGINQTELGSFQCKIKLSDSTNEFLNDPDCIQRFSWERRQKRRGKTAILNPHEILKMTSYYENKTDVVKERNGLELFLNFVSQFENSVLVAHNSEFDLKYINTRCKMYGIDVPMFKVIDTLKISKFFFVPLLNTLNTMESSILKSTLKSKTSGHVSSRLGDLANSFEINAENWHSASSDILILQKVLYKMINFLETNKETNINEEQKKSINKTLKRTKRTH
jgi:DNA polymerase III epsilon subunit-like protein